MCGWLLSSLFCFSFLRILRLEIHFQPIPHSQSILPLKWVVYADTAAPGFAELKTILPSCFKIAIFSWQLLRQLRGARSIIALLPAIARVPSSSPLPPIYPRPLYTRCWLETGPGPTMQFSHKESISTYKFKNNHCFVTPNWMSFAFCLNERFEHGTQHARSAILIRRHEGVAEPECFEIRCWDRKGAIN